MTNYHRINANWAQNETRKYLSMDTLDTVFHAPYYIYNRLDWSLVNEKNEKQIPKLEITRDYDKDHSGTLNLHFDTFSEISCKMKFKKFPFDKSKCKFRVSSTVYKAEVRSIKFQHKS